MSFNFHNLFLSQAHAAKDHRNQVSEELAEYERHAVRDRISRENFQYRSAYQRIDEAMKKLISAVKTPLTFDYFLGYFPERFNAQARLIGNQCKFLIHSGIFNFEIFNTHGEKITFPAVFAHEISHCTSEFLGNPYANIREELTWVGQRLGNWLGTNQRRQREYQADIQGMFLLVNACINPRVMRDYFAGVMEELKRRDNPASETTYFWMNHPSFPDRIKVLEEKLPLAEKLYQQHCPVDSKN